MFSLMPILMFTGCPKVLQDLDLDQYKPTVRLKNLDVQDVNFQGADTEFVFNVRNPNPIAVTLANLTYDLDLAGVNFFTGQKPDGMSLDAAADTELRIPVNVQFANLIKLAGDIKGADNVPFGLKGNIGFNTPIGVIELPYDESGEFPMLQKPDISFQGLRVTDLAVLQNKASLGLDLNVTHKQASILNFQDFKYDMYLKGTKVGGGTIAQFATIEPNETGVVTIPIDLNLLEAGTAIVGAIKDRDEIKVRLDADLNVDTPFGVLPLDLDKSKMLQLK